MAWLVPTDFSTGRLVTAADWNAELGTSGNMSMTMPAIVLAAGDLAYATGPNTLTRLAIGAAGSYLGPVSGAPAWTTQQLAITAGTAGAPSYSFAGSTNTGIFSPAAQTVSLATAGAERVRVDSAGNVFVGANLSTTNVAGVNVYSTTAGNGLMLQVSAASATQAAMYVYGSRGAVASPADVASGDYPFQLVTRAYSGGTWFSTSEIAFAVDGTFTSGQRPPSRIEFWTNGANAAPANRWQINASGHFLAGTDNAYDIGASGANRPRNGYFAGYVAVASGLNVSAGVLTLPAGSAGAPSLTFAGNTNSGLFSSAAGEVSITTSGVQRLVVASTGMTARTTTSTSYVGLSLINDASRRLDINYAGSGYVGGILAGGPSGETAMIATSGANVLQFGTNGTSRWYIDASGKFLSSSDNAYSIGTYGANRPAYVYVATAFAGPGSPIASTGAIRLSNFISNPYSAIAICARNYNDTADIHMLSCDGVNVTVGDIFAASTGLILYGGSSYGYAATNVGLYPLTDNLVSCGKTNGRWTAVWAVNGTIQTSHSSAKNILDVVSPADALRVARSHSYHLFTYKLGPVLESADLDERNRLADYRHVGIKAEEAHEWLSPDGETVNPQTTACIALAAVAGEADAREAAIAALSAEIARLRAELAALRRN